MQNEITVTPLVDILTSQLGEQVVMSGDTYVYHAGLLPVKQSDVDVALLEQQSLYLTDTKLNIKDDLLKSFNADVEQLSTAVPHEMVSWRKQEDEARAFLADNTVSTPFIDAQMTTRSLETKDELIAKIIANADTYQVAYAQLLGKYQNLIFSVDEATELGALEIVVW